MKTKFSKALYLVPLLYIGLIAIFMYLQFSGVDTFTSTVSHLTAMGRVSRSPLSGDDNISDLQIFGTGILFPLDKKNPIRIYSSDGLVHKAEPFKYRNFGNRMEIEMSSGLTLTMTPEEANNESVLMNIVFHDYSSIKSVSIPFSLMRDFFIDTTGGVPVFSINDKTSPEVTMLTLPMGATLDQSNNRITIPCGVEGIEGILIERTEEIQDPLSFWFSRKANLLSQAEYNLFLEEYLSEAMEGWRNSRFDTNNGTWEMADGEPVFSDKIATILLSESMNNNEYRNQYTRMIQAKEKSSQTLSLLTTPFLGDIIAGAKAELRTERTNLQTISNKIETDDYTVFNNHDLYNLIHIHSNEGMVEKLKTMADSADRSSMATNTLSGLLKYYLDRIESGDTGEKLAFNLDELAADYLLSKIQVLQEGFFLESNPYESDLLLSIRTGSYFIKIGNLTDRDIFSTLGMELIHSALKKSNIIGIIPAVLHFEDGHILTKGNVHPEDIYPIIFNNPYYPREYSASPEGTAGSWLYTSAPEVGVSRQGNSVKYSFKYKVGEIHNILIQGVEPFERMKMLGLNWKPDPVFYRYYSGWYYDKNNKSLYIKIRNKSEVEEIILYY
ncbi:MAG: hypothetical protein JEY99_17650 [Spirochaetales bacterium]|nr:hypothetical protein [Spirochaetales bacterium]